MKAHDVSNLGELHRHFPVRIRFLVLLVRFPKEVVCSCAPCICPGRIDQSCRLSAIDMIVKNDTFYLSDLLIYFILCITILIVVVCALSLSH